MKSYTDIEESKQLAEILPVESADQTWERVAIAGANLDVPEEMQYRHNGDVPFLLSSKVDLPCWSLTALLNIFPCSKESPIVDLTRGGWNPSFTRRWFATWEDENKNILYSCDGISPVDAVVELIMKLHEQKLL